MELESVLYRVEGPVAVISLNRTKAMNSLNKQIIADLTTAYVTSAPKTFLLKLCIGLIVGLVAHKIFHLSKEHSAKYVTGVTILASASGMAFKVVEDPLDGNYF